MWHPVCHSKMRQMSRSTLVASKNMQIPTVSEFDEIRRGSLISRDDSNGEVCFVIQDLEKFRIFTEIMILPFFRKLEFSKVSQAVAVVEDAVESAEAVG